MSGPQGPDANPWQVSGADQPATGAEQPYPETPAWAPPGTEMPAWQPPAYPQPYPQYGQPPVAPGYPPTQPYGTPTEYNPAAYGQPGPYGQPGAYGPPPQYGQYPQPGGYPMPGQPGQYPQYGMPGAEDAGNNSKRVTTIVLGSLGALLLLAVLILGFWKPGFFVTTKLDVSKAQQGVQQILTDESSGYGAKNVSDVKCNNGQNPTVKKGDNFTCEVSIDGTKRQVTVTFQDDKGTYEVGRPK
ncbi:DUF4333 domain-containing protein [Mycolicibacterium sp.]|jgi:hypothetical protein|uniref:DUF4333 domain-containing protein n=1 Tax=Mycolicibacterium sp. TaxID=2320850 RepID=UPI001A2AEF9D|nr:DUF4333 domain-containing protein [Mycolicibacterium sp.]MBJ7400359.1 DUF4333 domain-containing protein [Mycolicibacterium sp.]